MSLDTAFNDIKNRIEGLWPAIEPSVPLAFLDSGYQRDLTGAEFLVVEVEWSGGEGVTIGAPGSNLARRDGFIRLHALVLVGTGQGRPMQIAARAAAIFEDQQFGEVVCWSMEPGGGNSGTDDGLYFGQSVDVPFRIDEAV